MRLQSTHGSYYLGGNVDAAKRHYDLCMQSSPPPPTPSAHIGALLREWRGLRRLSQFNLAMEANVSARHLSFVETGKAQPSRDMVTRLADVLDVPLRERNALLVAAGYAPVFRETSLDTAAMAPVRRALEFILEHQNPFPAFVMNRYWDVQMVNASMQSIFGTLRNGGPKHTNILHQVFDPEDMRPLVGNWEEVAGDLIRHLHNEITASPSDQRLRTLLEEVLAYPNVPSAWRTRDPGNHPLPLLTTVFRGDSVQLHFFSTLTTFGTTRDVTLDELRIECMFPVDEMTADRCRDIASP